MTRLRDVSTFGDLVNVLDSLPVIMLNARRARRLSQREVAEQAGVSFSTISRIESGGELSSTSLRAILLWLDAPATLAERNTP